MPLRAGIDLIAIDSVAASVAEHGESYLRRVFSGRERSAYVRNGVADSSALAACFAAKEATIKVLRPTRAQVLPWSELEVLPEPGGRYAVHLGESARAAATAAGIGELTVSITRADGCAAAVVIAGFRADLPIMRP